MTVTRTIVHYLHIPGYSSSLYALNNQDLPKIHANLPRLAADNNPRWRRFVMFINFLMKYSPQFKSKIGISNYSILRIAKIWKFQICRNNWRLRLTEVWRVDIGYYPNRYVCDKLTAKNTREI